MRSKQIFQTIVIQYDEAVFTERYTNSGGKVAIIKIQKIADPTYYIEINLFNGWIDWFTHYPAANNINQAKGLTVMTLT
jgi:hypothetical protein